jgi:hypothetical protein
MSEDDEQKVSQSTGLPDPVTYMRKLHPDLYSDSNTVASIELSVLLPMFIFHLIRRTRFCGCLQCQGVIGIDGNRIWLLNSPS